MYIGYKKSFNVKQNLFFHLQINNGELTAETVIKFNLFNFYHIFFSNKKQFYVLEIDNGAESIRDNIEIAL